MTKDELIAKTRGLIIQGNVKGAINLLIEFLSKEDKYKHLTDEVIKISSKFGKLETRKRTNTIGHSDASLEEAQVTSSLVDLLSHLESNEFTLIPHEYRNKNLVLYILGTLLLLLIVIILFMRFGNLGSTDDGGGLPPPTNSANSPQVENPATEIDSIKKTSFTTSTKENGSSTKKTINHHNGNKGYEHIDNLPPPSVKENQDSVTTNSKIELSIFGKVIDEKSKPIDGVLVEFDDKQQSSQRTSTKKDGRFSMPVIVDTSFIGEKFLLKFSNSDYDTCKRWVYYRKDFTWLINMNTKEH